MGMVDAISAPGQGGKDDQEFKVSYREVVAILGYKRQQKEGSRIWRRSRNWFVNGVMLLIAQPCLFNLWKPALVAASVRTYLVYLSRSGNDTSSKSAI